jgi:hypothetical protein
MSHILGPKYIAVHCRESFPSDGCGSNVLFHQPEARGGPKGGRKNCLTFFIGYVITHHDGHIQIAFPPTYYGRRTTICVQSVAFYCM